MEGTLEKLLSIQGAEEQLTISTLTEPQKRPSELDEARVCFSPHQPPTGHTEPTTRANSGTLEPKPPPDMREVWREVFRMYSQYAPALRSAATIPDGYIEACKLFTETFDRAQWMASAGEDGEIIAIGAYEMLSDVWKRARERYNAVDNEYKKVDN